MSVRPPLLLASWALIVGCAGGDAETQAASVVRQQLDGDLALALREEMRIGAVEGGGPDELFRVQSAALTESGSLLILDAGNYRVAVFDSSGTFQREFGGRGEGPGEFQNPVGLAYRSDTLLIKDAPRNLVHSFLASGAHLATSVLRPADTSGDGLGAPVAVQDGWVVPLIGFFGEDRSLEVPRYRVRLFEVIADQNELGAPTGFSWEQVSEGQWVNNFFWVSAPLTHRPSWAIDGLGRVLVAASGDYVVEIFSKSGDLELRIENLVERLPITPALLDQWRESRRCDAANPECSSAADRAALAQPLPEYRPVVLKLMAFHRGHFAVQRDDLDPNPFDGEPPRIWDFFEPSGEHLGHVEAAMTPLWFDGERLVASERDELDVEYVVRYRVGEG